MEIRLGTKRDLTAVKSTRNNRRLKMVFKLSKGDPSCSQRSKIPNCPFHIKTVKQDPDRRIDIAQKALTR